MELDAWHYDNVLLSHCVSCQPRMYPLSWQTGHSQTMVVASALSKPATMCPSHRLRPGRRRHRISVTQSTSSRGRAVTALISAHRCSARRRAGPGSLTNSPCSSRKCSMSVTQVLPIITSFIKMDAGENMLPASMPAQHRPLIRRINYPQRDQGIQQGRTLWGDLKRDQL